MPSKFQTTVEMVAHTAKDITSHPETFMSFLETAANNYKYSFRDQMLIFAQNLIIRRKKNGKNFRIR